MFVQVIQGRVGDAGELRAALDRWATEIGPHATGWRGSTSGVAADGTTVGIACFADEQAARANSNRPEQHAWWMETAKLFSGDVTFHDCTEVYEIEGGVPDEAGFVQVVQGRVGDLDQARDLLRRMENMMQGRRPEMVGGLVCVHDGNAYTDVFYFTSESEARAAERQEQPPEVRELMDEQAALTSDVRFLDLTDPWLHAPR
jgi:hypothetical protein